MRTPLRVLVALLAAFTGAAASAAPMNWSGTSTTFFSGFPPVVTTGGGVATINGSGGSGHLGSLRLAGSRGAISSESVVLLVTDPDTVGNSIAALRFEDVAGATGTFTNLSGALASSGLSGGGTLPVAGLVRLCLVTTDCLDQLQVLLTTQTPGGDVIGVGVGGLLTIGGDSPIRISVVGAPWTIKTGTVLAQQTTTGKQNQLTTVVILKGFAHDPGSGTTGTGTPGGVVQLVTPTQVLTNLSLGANQKISSGITLRVRFVPEPGLVVLLGAGVVGLAALGRPRRR